MNASFTFLGHTVLVRKDAPPMTPEEEDLEKQYDEQRRLNDWKDGILTMLPVLALAGVHVTTSPEEAIEIAKKILVLIAKATPEAHKEPETESMS